MKKTLDSIQLLRSVSVALSCINSSSCRATGLFKHDQPAKMQHIIVIKSYNGYALSCVAKLFVFTYSIIGNKNYSRRALKEYP